MIINAFKRSADPELTAKSLFNAVTDPVFPLDIQAVALGVGIQEIQEFPDKNLEGMLVATLDKSAGYISVGTHIREPARKRFTIAHELGHFLITSHENTYRCASADLEVYSSQGKPMEVEANLFAANILMPEKEFMVQIRREELGRRLFQTLMDHFGSSLSSTLIRYIRLSSEPVAVVMSENSIIKWAFPSTEFRYYIPANVPLSNDSMAREYFRGNDVSEEFEEVETDAWFDTNGIRHHLVLKELAMPMPYYKKVLSFLWLDEDEDEIDDFSIEFDGYLKIKE